MGADKKITRKNMMACLALVLSMAAGLSGCGHKETNTSDIPQSSGIEQNSETVQSLSDNEGVSGDELQENDTSENDADESGEAASSADTDLTAVSTAAQDETDTTTGTGESSPDMADGSSASSEEPSGNSGSASTGGEGSGSAASGSEGDGAQSGTEASDSDRDELIALLKDAVKQTNNLTSYHAHTETTITNGSNSGETTSTTELDVSVEADPANPLMSARGSVIAFEKSYPIEIYFVNGYIYQNIAGVKHGKSSNIDSALRTVSSSLWYPVSESIDTISLHDAGNGMIRVLVNVVSTEPGLSSYVETFINTDGYVDSQHFVTHTVSAEDENTTSTDKWITYTTVEGDYLPVFPDFSDYIMEEG